MKSYGFVESMTADKVEALHILLDNADSIVSGLIKKITVQPEAGSTVSPWDETKKVSDIQENIVVGDNKITGTLKFVKGGIAPSGIMAGDGYFLALKFSGVDASITSKKVGLVPSEGSGLVELDADMNAFIKIKDKNQQIFEVVSTDGTRSTIQKYDLSELQLKKV